MGLSSDSFRRKRRPPSSIALTHSRQATFSFSVDLRGHILKLATFIAVMISLSNGTFPLWPETLDSKRTSSVKNFETKCKAKLGRDTLSLKHAERNLLLKTSVIGYHEPR